MSDFPVAVPFVIVVSFRGLIMKLTSDVQDWIVLWTSESKTVILVKFISGFDTVLGLSELTVTLDDQEFVS